MKYSDGDICPGTNERATSDIYFICDPNHDDSPRLLSSKGDCQYLFNWKTSAACETKSSTGSQPMSGGGIAVIVILSIVGAYIIGGVLYNRFVRKERGLEQIPHFNLCQALYYTVADRCVSFSPISFNTKSKGLILLVFLFFSFTVPCQVVKRGHPTLMKE